MHAIEKLDRLRSTMAVNVLTKWSSVCLGIQESTVLVNTTGEGRLDEYDLWALFW